jgi:hypothetical protein
MFSEIQIQMDMIVKIFRPLVSVYIPIYNIVGTLFGMLVFGLAFIMAIITVINPLLFKYTPFVSP